MSDLLQQFRQLSVNAGLNIDDQRAAARKEYAQILLRHKNPLPGDAERLEKILPDVFPMDDPDYPESFAIAEARPGARYRIMKRDIERLERVGQLENSLADAERNVREYRDRLSQAQAEFDAAIPALRDMEYLHRRSHIDRYEYRIEVIKKELADLEGFWRNRAREVEYAKHDLSRIFNP